jgi:hypothetical protein
MQYNLVRRDDSANITVVVDGEMFVADDQHPLFEEIVEAALANDENVVNLFDASLKAAEKFENLSERVSVAGGRVYVDQTEVEDTFGEQVLRFMEEGVDDWKPLVLFLEKVYSNTAENIRENLSRWLKAEAFTILPNGNILGYRGLNSDFTSKHSGPGVVNGVPVNGHLDNSVGNTVEIDAKLVENNPSVGCASGLHVGTHEYAKSWAGGGPVVTVEVDPIHVRSVPYECGDAKMRVSKYVVKEVVTEKVNETVATGNTYAYDDSDEICPDCFEYYEDCYCDY